VDAYVLGDASSAYLDIHATLGGTDARARDVLDVTSFAPSWVALEGLPDGLHAMTWTARNAGVPWAALHRYVRHVTEAFHPRGLGTYPWHATSLLCHYVACPDVDPFLGRRRVSASVLQNASQRVSQTAMHENSMARVQDR
jgi:hypothetical protein